jgi:hypothetical protein
MFFVSHSYSPCLTECWNCGSIASIVQGIEYDARRNDDRLIVSDAGSPAVAAKLPCGTNSALMSTVRSVNSAKPCFIKGKSFRRTRMKLPVVVSSTYQQFKCPHCMATESTG